MKVQRFDLSADPMRLKPHRWNPLARRDPASMRGVVSHSWASKVSTTAAERLRYGEPMALARRALEAPYNISAGVTSRGVPVVSLAHPVTRYTYASDAGCRDFISIGVMGVFPLEEETRNGVRHTALTEAMFAAVDGAMAWASELLAASPGPHVYITHRQCANGPRDHFACSGEAVVRMCLASQAVASGRLIADPDLVLIPEFGRPWPASWRLHLGAHPASGNVCDLGLPNSATLVSSEHHALPLMPVGEDGNPATHSA